MGLFTAENMAKTGLKSKQNPRFVDTKNLIKGMDHLHLMLEAFREGLRKPLDECEEILRRHREKNAAETVTPLDSILDPNDL